MSPQPKTGPDWNAIRDRIDLTAVATNLLGPARKRSGRRLLWCCPFHDDRDPSFEVDPSTHRWKCWPCDKGGDAPALVMAMKRVTFPEAVRILADQAGIVTPSGRPGKAPWPGEKPDKPKGQTFPPKGSTDPRPGDVPGPADGLTADEAIALVEESERRLWSPEGLEAMAYLMAVRGLTQATIRRRRLGYVAKVSIPTKDGLRYYRAGGIVIPWFDGERLSLVKIRQADGVKPRYAEAFRDRPKVYPGVTSIRPLSALVMVEGEFDAILLGQELEGLASVVTFGGSSNRPDRMTQLAVSSCRMRFAAHDGDESGDRAASAWDGGAERVRPPAGKDWTDAWRAGIDLRRWWIEMCLPEEFDREERAAMLEFDGGLSREAAEHAARTNPRGA